MYLSLTANSLGVLSLFAAIIAITPSLINLLKLSFKNKKSIFQIARIGLISTVCFGLIHGLLMTQLENINFYAINTYWVYAGGFFTFNIFAFLAFMYAELKLDTKKLNYLSYAALFLLACHLGQHLLPVGF